MAKAPKRAFVCNECGADYPRWQGQCSACHAWNTITEMRIAASPQVARNERLSGYAGNAGGIIAGGNAGVVVVDVQGGDGVG